MFLEMLMQEFSAFKTATAVEIMFLRQILAVLGLEMEGAALVSPSGGKL